MARAKFVLRRVAQAALVAATCHPAAGLATVTASGSTWTYPANLPLGPGDTALGNNAVFVGNDAAGALAVNGGSLLSAGALLLGTGGSGTGSGVAVIDGAGTRVELTGDGFSDGVLHRLDVGNWGTGSLTVSGGAVLDGRVNAGACVGVNHYCGTYIGNGAGSDGTFTVTGAGSQALLLRGTYVGNAAVFHPPVDGFTFGTPGASTQGRVNVLAGGSLRTETVFLGLAPGGGSPTGRERSFADVVVSGPDSTWRVEGGSLEPSSAYVFAGNHANNWVTMRIADGGRMQFDAVPSQLNGINLAHNGGHVELTLTGAGSAMAMNGGLLQVGRRLGTATMQVGAGGRVDDAYYVSVGRDGAAGRLDVEGSGSVLTINRMGAEGTSDAGFTGGLHIGRNATGTVNVAGGGRIDIVSTSGRDRARYIEIGVGAASSGTLNIDGAGSVVHLSVASLVPGGGPGETASAYVAVGAQGAGALNVTGGGKLLIDSSVVSTDANRRATLLNIGGGSDTTVGARGIAVVRGAGSEISVTGDERFVGVGRGPSSFGQLTLADGGKLSSTSINVGRAGAIGVIEMDAGRIELTGQYAAPAVSSAPGNTGFGIGVGGGTGIVRMANGSAMSLVNMGSGGMGLALGGSSSMPGGDGALTMADAATITIVAAPGLANFVVGRQGSGVLRMSGGSRIDIGDGRFRVAAESGSDGTVVATGGSVIDAGWVGVGRNRLSDGSSVDGGTGTMILNGATLNVSGDVVVGTNGFLGGSAGSINVGGTVTNYGIFSPGSSPGVFTINGNYAAGAGSRLILEVASDGHGGFVTDELRFGAGAAVDLSAMQVEFRFLGAADPNAFQTSGGFDIGSFVRQADSNGALSGLDPGKYAGVSFSARADAYVFQAFSFSAAGGAAFVAVPVPEPGTWTLFAGGLALLGWRARRRSG